MAEEKERLGWERTLMLAGGGALGAAAGVFLTALLIHFAREQGWL